MPEDFVVSMNYLVSDEVVNQFLSALHEGSQIETTSNILTLLLRKMNSEVDEYNSYQK